MNERITFVVAALVGDSVASLALSFYAPLNPLCIGFPNSVNYLAQHAPLAVIVWLVLATGVWVLMGPLAMRRRQNLSTKISLLTWLGVAGVVIDNAVSLGQYISNRPEVITGGWLTRSVFVGFAARTVFYAVGFGVVVVASYMLSLTRRSTVTPPPSFGRE